MNSINTKAANYVKDGDHCITQVVAIAEKGGFRIYVAWEWENMAKKKVYGFVKSRAIYPYVDQAFVMETANTGMDIGGTGEEKKVFANLF